MKWRIVLLAAVLVGTAWAAEGVPLTFNAVLSMGKEKRFGLATEDTRRSGWVAVGDSFEGYLVKSFDEPTQTLVLERDGQTYRLPIATGGIQTLDTRTATLAEATDVMNKMHFEEMIAHTIEQQKQAMATMGKQMLGPLANQVSPEELSALQSKVIDALWAQMKPDELKKELTQIYADTFTKDELRAMSDFYASPAGQSALEKQPEVQRKLLAIMIPRLTQAVPQIQQIERDFAARQAAKLNPPAPAATPPANSGAK